jgi:hypothetical protein
LAISCTLAIRIECIKKATSVIEAQQSVKWSQHLLRIIAYFAVDKKLQNHKQNEDNYQSFNDYVCNANVQLR